MNESFDLRRLNVNEKAPIMRVTKTCKDKRSNKCNQCEYSSSHAGQFKTHLKSHSGEKSNKCNQCNYALKRFEKTFENTFLKLVFKILFLLLKLEKKYQFLFLFSKVENLFSDFSSQSWRTPFQISLSLLESGEFVFTFSFSS